MDRQVPGRHTSVWTGEFRDEKLEKEYHHAHFYKVRSSVRPLVIFLASIFSVVAIFELFSGNGSIFPFISIPLCGLFLAASFLIILKVSTVGDFYSLSTMLTAYELLSVSVFFYLAYITADTYHYAVIGLGVICYSFMFFIIPNRWLYAAGLSSFTILAYFIVFYKSAQEMSIQNQVIGNIFVLSGTALVAAISLQSAIDQRNQYIGNLRLLQLSLTDPLTGIANRGRFNDSLQSWVKCANEYNVSLSLVLFDFDDFKRVNDTYGHLIGDQVILQTVNIVDDAIRHRDLFARWGGEEFTLLFPDTQLDEAMEIVERLRRTISANHYVKCGHVTASFGLVQYRKGESPDAFMDRADRMLYTAKADGKNCIRAAG